MAVRQILSPSVGKERENEGHEARELHAGISWRGAVARDWQQNGIGNDCGSG
jgi:hypothetical protein